VDLSDRRDLQNLGRLDVTNVRLALGASARFLKELRRFSPTVVYLLLSQNTLAYLRDGLLIWLARHFSGARIVVHLHGGFFRDFVEGASAPTRWFVDQTLRGVDAGIVYGQRMARHLEPWVRRVHVVPNGTAIGFGVDIEAKLRERARSPVVNITYLSNLVKSKGILTLLESAAQVARQRESVCFRIAGAWSPDPTDGTSAAAIELEARRLVREARLDNRVVFLGRVLGDEKCRLLWETDVFVLPSSYAYEGHPVSIIEAMAFGCPVVSTDRGVIAETVVHGESGYIVPACDPVELARAIEMLVDSRAEREAMSRGARKRYEAEYTDEQMITRIAAVLTQTGASPQSVP
jgi:glycosyltransferase involved in cell wall biosynthesis